MKGLAKGIRRVRLLNTDPGKATNRTVVTFVDSPQALVEAVFRAIKKSGEPSADVTTLTKTQYKL